MGIRVRDKSAQTTFENPKPTPTKPADGTRVRDTAARAESSPRPILWCQVSAISLRHELHPFCHEPTNFRSLYSLLRAG